MSAPVNKPRPGLRFTWLGILTAGLIALIVGGSIWSNAAWSPNLALDLEGGTSIILEPQVEDADVTTEQLEQAVSIIRQRVDATGVSEAEITTQGDRNIVVNLPGNPDEETRDLVRSSAQLAFRRVAVVAAPEPQTEEAPAEEEAPAGPELTDEEQQRLDELLGGGGAAAPEDQPAGGGEVFDRLLAAGVDGVLLPPPLSLLKLEQSCAMRLNLKLDISLTKAFVSESIGTSRCRRAAP